MPCFSIIEKNRIYVQFTFNFDHLKYNMLINFKILAFSSIHRTLYNYSTFPYTRYPEIINFLLENTSLVLLLITEININIWFSSIQNKVTRNNYTPCRVILYATPCSSYIYIYLIVNK